MADRVEVARFDSLAEAQIAAGYLRSHGLDVDVLDAHHGSAAPFLIFALGWFRLSALEGEEAEARRLLAIVAAQPAEAAAPPPGWADRCVQVVTAVAGAVVGVPFVRKHWRRRLEE